MKVLNIKISYKLLFLISCLLLIAVVLPIILVSRYMVPAGDDFSFSTETYHALAEGKSVIVAAINKVISVYNSWQGSFFAVFLMTLQPGIFGYNFYGIATSVIMTGSLIFGIFWFLKSFLFDLFGSDKAGSMFISAIICIMCTQFLPLAYQSFFWYNASVYYTFFFALVLITSSLVIRYLLKGGKFRVILISVLSFIIGGGNYVTALFSLLALGLCIFYLIMVSNSRYKSLILPFILLLTALIISAVAPGNAVRQLENPDHPGPAAAILSSLKYALIYIKSWSDASFLAMVLILSPVLWCLSSSATRKFRFPIIHTVISFLLFASMFCPHIYAEGSPGPGRILNIIYFTFLILTAVNLYLWLGYLSARFGIKSNHDVKLLPLAVCAIASCCFLLISVRSGHSVTSVIAVNELRSGEAESYYAQNASRFDAMLNSDEMDYTFPPITSTPVLLFSEDMKDDPDNYMNRDTASYFYKNSIIVK